MKKLFTLLLSLAFLITSPLLKAQEIQKGNAGMWPSIIKYDATAPAFSKNNISIVDAAGKQAALTNGIEKNVERDANGTMHYRYQQTVNGIAIENADMLVHVRSGKIISQNGKWIKDFPQNLSAAPFLTEANAITKALQNIGAAKYKWQNAEEEAFIKKEQQNLNATFFPKATLVYYSGERDVIPTGLRLAYKFDIYAQEPVSRQLIFVDAADGKILGKRELIHEADRTGTAYTAYSGTQSIKTTRVNNNTYTLRETGRGGGINTFNLQKGYSYAGAVDFVDSNNSWNNVNSNKDEYATDAHWATEKTYDFYFESFGRNSIDNNGMALNSYVHYATNYFNAFWDGSRMTYGDGDAAHGNKPLTSLDVCGHEITHGVTERTSALVYSYESGAMNEGFSDIFGTAIEAFARPNNNDWLIGGDFFTIRSMSNPNAYGQPDTYLGTNWYAGAGDNGGVHYNSGVLNHWFYLLTVGGNGVNDHSFSFNVGGIGITKAAAIAYRLNTVYLVSTSVYSDARILGIQAAEDLYGVGSNEAVQTANAWNAVGLYAASCVQVSGLSVSNILDRTATLRWATVSGATSYSVQYKVNTSSVWSTMVTTTADSFNLSWLNASTLYDWRINTNCNSQFTVGQFTTAAPICSEVPGIAFTTGSNSVTVSWDYVSYAVSFDLEYKLASASNWTVAGNTTASSYTLTGLSYPATYDLRIKTNCNFGSSNYAVAQFTTSSFVCGTPTGLAFTYANNISTFTWDAVPGATSYTFQITWAGGYWEEGLEDITTTNSYDITNLMQGGSFQFRVTTTCEGGNSVPSNAFLFTTPCSAPGSLTSSNVTGTSATLNWVPAAVNNGNTAFKVYYRLAGSNAAWTALSATTATSVNVSGLAPGATYDWYVQKLCDALNSVQVYSQFSTLIGCTTPGGLKSENISTSQATVSWTPVSGAGSYKLQYKTAAASTFTTISGLATNSYNLSNLAANTTYNFQVQTVCSSGSSSYSSPATFSTYCVSSGNNSQEWIDFFKLGTMQRSSGADASGYYNAGSSITPLSVAAGATGIAGTISVGYSGPFKDKFYAVYIDFNRNGSFNDAGERVAGQSSITSTGNYNFTINIPSTATPGITAVRVVMLRQSTSVTPCLTGNRGETEDYYINITNGSLQGFGGNSITAAEVKSVDAVTVGPNPSSGRYNVSLPADFKVVHFEVANMSGILVKQGKLISARQIVVDITEYPAGIYLLRLAGSAGESKTIKLIKE